MTINNSIPRLYADFINIDDERRVRLNCQGTKVDLEKQHCSLIEGMKVVLYDEDVEAEGVVEFSPKEKIWVATVDWDQVFKGRDPLKKH